MEADLIFHAGATSNGFLQSDLTKYVADADTITRELIQNGLDAAVISAGRDLAEINLSIVECSLSDLPAFNKYSHAFQAARRWRNQRQKALSSNEQGVIERIHRVLSAGTCSVLICRDNGIGLNQERVNDLMSESNSDKPDEGAGTSGVGHKTAFSASDLRYVLYAGRTRSQDPLTNLNRTVDVGGAHAILAPYKDASDRYAADGYWMNPQGDLFERSAENFPDYAPGILEAELDLLETTGSAIGITGFDFFREDSGATAAAELMADAAAVNFLVAIAGGWLTITIRPSPDEPELIVDQQSIHARLSKLAQKPARREKGRLYRTEALRASETLRHGTQIDLPDLAGATLRVRLLDEGTKENSRVQVFRDGMWITSIAPELEPSDFGSHRKFDAVLSLTKGGRLYTLVRKSEGPEHRGIDKHRLESAYRELRALTRSVADAIRAYVPLIGSQGPIAPYDFAMLPLGEHAVAEVVPEYDPFMPDGDNPITTIGDDEDDDPEIDDPPKPPGPNPKPRVRRRPSVRRGFKVRSSVRPIVDADGTFRDIKAHIRLPANARKSGKISVSVSVGAGSDATADLPLRPAWQMIESIQYGDAVARAAGGGAYVVDVPHDATDLTVRLANTCQHPHSVAINVEPAKRGSQAS